MVDNLQGRCVLRPSLFDGAATRVPLGNVGSRRAVAPALTKWRTVDVVVSLVAEKVAFVGRTRSLQLSLLSCLEVVDWADEWPCVESLDSVLPKIWVQHVAVAQDMTSDLQEGRLLHRIQWMAVRLRTDHESVYGA